MSQPHSAQCAELIQKALEAREQYHTHWPDHCEHCGGWGGHGSNYDPSPAGVALSAGSMPDFDPCEVCTEEEKCPRCGKPHNHETSQPCKSCGWTGKKPGDGLPPEPECICWDDWETEDFNPSDELQEDNEESS